MTTPPEYCLIIRRGPNPDTQFPIDKDLISIGRDEQNDIHIDDVEISRFHARVIHADGVYSIIDLDSMNGTFINGTALKKATPLQVGDKIGVGESVVLGFEKITLPN